MGHTFHERLTDLRKERNLTQKEVAEALDVSPALLSHYEKGIRECGLDFLKKAAAYYDVTCDYILGVSDTRRAFGERFDEHDTPQDKEFRIGTLFRAAAMLSDNLSAASASERLRSYYALSIFRVVVQSTKNGLVPKDWISLPPLAAESLSDAIMDNILKDRLPREDKGKSKAIAPPVCIQTLVSNCERILKKEFGYMIAESDKA